MPPTWSKSPNGNSVMETPRKLWGNPRQRDCRTLREASSLVSSAGFWETCCLGGRWARLREVCRQMGLRGCWQDLILQGGPGRHWKFLSSQWRWKSVERAKGLKEAWDGVQKDPKIRVLVLRDYVSLGSRHQIGNKYARILLGGTTCERQWGGSPRRLGEPSVHEASLTPGEEEREGRMGGRS